MSRRSRIAVQFLPAMLLTVFIAVVSLWEHPYIPPVIRVSDKVMHGGMYVVLALSWMVPLARMGWSRMRQYVYVCIGVTLYGGLLEVLQRYCTQTRSGEWMDVLADFVGALTGVLIVGMIAKWRNIRSI